MGKINLSLIDQTVLVLSFTDQYNWGVSTQNQFGKSIYLNSSTDVDYHWYGSLCQVFSKVIRYDIYRNANLGGICHVNKEIQKIVEVYKPKYVIYPCNFSGIVSEETLLLIRKKGCIVIADFFDDDAYFVPLSQWLGKTVDYVFTHVPSLVEKYEDLGINCKLTACIPMNPSQFVRHLSSHKLYDASFTGFLYSHRKKYLRELNKLGTPVHYLGGGYDKDKLSFAQFIENINLTRINMNFSSGRSGRIIIVGRVFEVTLCGGFLLTEYIQDIEKWFEPDKEIVHFRSVEEASDKIDYYLKHPRELEQIASSGYERALDYSGPRLLQRVFSEIETETNGRHVRAQNHILSSLSPLHVHSADQHYVWVKAILRSAPPLREEWYGTLQLVLRTNPGHIPAQKMLKKAEKWGDPEPLRRIAIYFKYHVNKSITTLIGYIYRFISKLKSITKD